MALKIIDASPSLLPLLTTGTDLSQKVVVLPNPNPRQLYPTLIVAHGDGIPSQIQLGSDDSKTVAFLTIEPGATTTITTPSGHRITLAGY